MHESQMPTRVTALQRTPSKTYYGSITETLQLLRPRIVFWCGLVCRHLVDQLRLLVRGSEQLGHEANDGGVGDVVMVTHDRGVHRNGPQGKIRRAVRGSLPCQDQRMRLRLLVSQVEWTEPHRTGVAVVAI